MIEIAILGHGVVGSGVVEVLATHKDSILKRAQNEIDIKYILRTVPLQTALQKTLRILSKMMM